MLAVPNHNSGFTLLRLSLSAKQKWGNTQESFSNLINIKLDHPECTASSIELKPGLLNIRSLTSKALIANKTITDQQFIFTMFNRNMD